jgi:predicted anti-sigma-YlaC factor YlaD
MKNLMNKMMNTCKEISIQVTNDEDLSAVDRLKQMIHLMMCPACQKFYKQIQYLNQGIRKIKIKDVDVADLSEKIINKYKQCFFH